jgi:hypothetical protein
MVVEVSFLQAATDIDGFESAVQIAVYSALVANVDLDLLVNGRIYDAQPLTLGSQALTFPYVTIGEDTHADWSTDTESGDDATITIHTWSRYNGRKEIKEIQGLIYSALHRASLTLSGYALVSIDWISSDSVIDVAGETRHGVQTFRLLLDKL